MYYTQNIVPGYILFYYIPPRIFKMYILFDIITLNKNWGQGAGSLKNVSHKVSIKYVQQ